MDTDATGGSPGAGLGDSTTRVRPPARLTGTELTPTLGEQGVSGRVYGVVWLRSKFRGLEVFGVASE